METNKKISKYIYDNISPKEDDIEKVANVYEKVGNILWSSTIFQSGSYPRSTALRPVNDLDIIKVLPQWKTEKDAGIVLQEVLALLSTKQAQETIGYKRIKLQKSSVWLYFWNNDDEFSVDIVPAIEMGIKDISYQTPIYKVPEIQKMPKRKRLKKYNDLEYQPIRIESAPKAYKKHAEWLDELSSEDFRFFSRFIKAWKRSAKQRCDDFCLKSFHLEQICWSIVQQHSSVWLHQLIVHFFNEILSVINTGRQFVDLAYAHKADYEKRYIDQYMEDPEKNTQKFKDWTKSEVLRVQKILATLEYEENKDNIERWLALITEYRITTMPIINKATAIQQVDLSQHKWLHGWGW